MSSAFRLITAIRDIGVTDQDFATIRRLQTINIVTLLATLMSLSYGLTYAVYDWHYFRIEIAFIVVIVTLYMTVYLLTERRWPDAAMWWLFVITLIFVSVINWLLGPALAGINYLIVTPVIFSLMLREGDRISVWPIALIASAIFAVVMLSGREGSVDQLPEAFRLAFILANVFGAALLAAGVGLIFRWLIQKTENQLDTERKLSDRLLRAILPDPVAEQLKANETKIIAERFSDATAIFADIVGFTKRSAEVDAELIVAELNRIFGRMDDLAQMRGVEKIKTIGDAYFAVSGVPEPALDHAERVADFALDLQEVAREWRSTIWPELRLRIAIHSGPVVAGVIGRTKFAYDVWGDTINTAARLEERCPPGDILLSEYTAASLPPRFVTEFVGEFDLRGKGKVGAYRLSDRRPN